MSVTILKRQAHDLGDNSENCWCNPRLDQVYDKDGNLKGTVIIHNDEVGVALGLDPVYVAG